MTPSPAPTRAVSTRLRLPSRPRGRRLLWTCLALCAVLVALPVADRAAAAMAESRLADRIAGRQDGSVVGTPDVSIDAFPFLPAAAEGTFPRVAVRADAVTAEGQPVAASVELREVTEKGDGYTAASAEARFTTPLDSLGGGLGGEESRLSADQGRLRIERDVFGLTLTVVAELRLSGRTITAVPVEASFAGSPIDPKGPRISEAFSGQQRAVPDLPMGLVPTKVSVDDTGVTLHARADDVRLT
jgi:hypothetical protein